MKTKKIQWTLLYHSQCRAFGRLDQAIQLAMNYRCEDVPTGDGYNAAAKISSQNCKRTSWPGNLKCRCTGKSTQRFFGIPAKKYWADHRSCGLPFDGDNTSQDLNTHKGASLQDFEKSSKDLEIKIDCMATTTVVGLHAGFVNDVNIIPRDVTQTTSMEFWRDPHKEPASRELRMGLTYKVVTMNWQLHPNLLGFSRNDRQNYYAAVLTCIVMKLDKYMALLNIGTVDPDRKFVYSVLIEVQYKQAALRIRMIILVTSSDCNQHMQMIEFRIFLHTGCKMSDNMKKKNCNEMDMWALCQNPSDKISAAYGIMLSRNKFDIFLNQFLFPGTEETLLTKVDKFNLLFAASSRSPFIWSDLCAYSDVETDDPAVAAFVELKDLKNVMEESIKGSTI
ncbi:hypothetical protein HPB52_009860 [Rhipicephalus sanguineus]|uniref:Uncharacterized protein n=1 Tax=Rhipicephalus sanguineus TaxID=34632 RepID=A0A9D4PKA3_RHISA|nr:hypothetical protein HPB52_009860 [Rhipicephalus sanguineus]